MAVRRLEDLRGRIKGIDILDVVGEEGFEIGALSRKACCEGGRGRGEKGEERRLRSAGRVKVQAALGS